MLFECALAPNSTTHPQMLQLAFIEELWRYSPPTKDQLDSQYGCTLLYLTSLMSMFYVIPCNQILGPAAICRNPAPPRIPPGGLRGCRLLNPCAQADTGPHDSSGSELYRLNIWYMMWGSMISVQPRYRLPAPLTQAQKTLRRQSIQKRLAVRVPGYSWQPKLKA